MHRLTKAVSGIASAAALALVAAMDPAGAAGSAPVGTTPASYTPWLSKTVPDQRVNQLVQCGDTMFAVGTISAVQQAGQSYTRSNAFSFSATTGAVTSWAPSVNGNVHTVAVSPDCSTAYLGGTFSSVNGVGASNIAAVDAASGALKPGFAMAANNSVLTMQYTHGALIAGGSFTQINGAWRQRLASLSPTTGAVTSYLHLTMTGNYPRTHPQVYNSQLSHAGDKLLIEGVFTAIAGQPRVQAAILDLGPTSVTADPWYATELNRACVDIESFYVRSANWSPDDGTIYIATTGYHPKSGLGSRTSDPRDGFCDAAAAFPATSGTVTHTWINYTGCDSYYSVVADANDVYVAGHERWANNPLGCDYAGPGAVSRPGVASLDPNTGQATSWNPTRSLGYGASDMIVTDAGLWIASDIFSNGMAQKCGGVTNKGGICLLPY